jgi:hypothetical protein
LERSDIIGFHDEHLQRHAADRKASSGQRTDHKPIVVGCIGLDRGDVEFLEEVWVWPRAIIPVALRTRQQAMNLDIAFPVLEIDVEPGPIVESKLLLARTEGA